MLARVQAAAVQGVDALRVTIEVDAAHTLPSWITVGLPARSVVEGRLRVRAAIERCGFSVRSTRVVVSLAPADVPKDGASYDLAIALALLHAAAQVPIDRLDGYIVLGELALDGGLRPVRGVLPIAAAARRLGARGVIVPRANAREAAAVDVEVRSASHLADILAWCRGEAELPIGAPPDDAAPRAGRAASPRPDLSEVRGQRDARRALEIAASGGHSLLLAGPPGCGKSMLARRLPGILPPLTLDEALETTAIHSVAGLLPREAGLLETRPFRAPHHTASPVALVGGGPDARPGEVSLAHNGVLFLDELPEFPRSALESLRQPMEDGVVVISRARARVTLPARSMLVAAMNLCPCGALGDAGRRCECTPLLQAGYRARVSAPLLDRLDLHLALHPVRLTDLLAANAHERAESSDAVRVRVAAARRTQAERFGPQGPRNNADMSPEAVSRYCPLPIDTRRAVESAIRRFDLSARAFHRVLRVARTIADLRGGTALAPEDVLEAISFRRPEDSSGASRALHLAPNVASS